MIFQVYYLPQDPAEYQDFFLGQAYSRPRVKELMKRFIEEGLSCGAGAPPPGLFIVDWGGTMEVIGLLDGVKGDLHFENFQDRLQNAETFPF